MKKTRPDIFKMIRAPFLSSIISPLFIGTFVAVTITSKFEALNFILVLIIGLGLHIATNVYNDIYDTLQGTDKINVHRNEFSGGSGVLIDDPNLMPTMYWLARTGLLLALIASIGLFFRIDNNLRLYLIILYLLSTFFSKYYTATPVKLAYRGFGEFFVWFAFGPMAILIGAVSQNLGLHKVIIATMPITGISTLSILLIGQIIDLEADKATGKWGIAVRIGIHKTNYFYLFVQIFLCLNIIILSQLLPKNGWMIFISLIPYVLLTPKILKLLITKKADVESYKKAAGLNVSLHLLFSLLFILSILLILIF